MWIGPTYPRNCQWEPPRDLSLLPKNLGTSLSNDTPFRVAVQLLKFSVQEISRARSWGRLRNSGGARASVFCDGFRRTPNLDAVLGLGVAFPFAPALDFGKAFAFGFAFAVTLALGVASVAAFVNICGWNDPLPFQPFSFPSLSSQSVC